VHAHAVIGRRLQTDNDLRDKIVLLQSYLR
jgi:hypothetical protein